MASLAPVPGTRAANPSSYALSGVVLTPNDFPVYGGVTVQLISGATHQVYNATTNSNGRFSFTNGGTGGALVPGDWGLWVPPQANLSLKGCKPCGILPANDTPVFSYLTAQNLTSATYLATVSGVSTLRYNATIFGNATQGGSKIGGADVELIAPGYNGFVLSNNTTQPAGNFSLKAPWGTWVVRTVLPGTPDEFDYQQVTVAAPTLTVNPAISKYLTYGSIRQKSAPSTVVPYGGNVSLYDLTNDYLWSSPTSDGFYAVGSYPAGFSGSGTNSFEVILQTIGYQTVWYPLTVSGSNPSGGAVPRNVEAAAQFDPAVYLTNLTYSTGFKWLNTSTSATLSNDSVIPELPNASVGQLWAQLALDWQHNLTFAASNMATVNAWVESEGPFFPAGADLAKLNGSGYNETPTGGTFTVAPGSGCTTGYCGLNSSAGLAYSWAKDYSLNGTAPTNASTYTASFTFRHPTNYQAINYTISLPTGYALQANTPAPAGSRLVAAGTGGTWTKFTLVAEPYSSASTTATFNFVKYGKVTANVNATVSEFAFSKQNVLNATHGNYSVLVGVGQNVTFSAASSTFPAGTNGSKYVWTWGDGNSSTTTNVASYHTYGRAGEFSGTLNLTSSGGTTANVTFHVYVGNGGISGKIVSNATSAETKTGGSGVTYLEVNWSTSLQFNASGFSSTVYSGSPVAGKLSVAAWNVTYGPKNQTYNFTAASGSYVADNVSVTFAAAGDDEYLSSATIGGTSESFLGWQYNITVKVWDAVGEYTSQELIVLVRDTQKPVSVATIQDASNKNITSAGVTEGTNHTAELKLVSSYAFDPDGGALVWYNWTIKDSANSSVNMTVNLPARSGLRAPLAYALWLQPQTKPYTFNLTVTDRAGNTNYNVASVTVAINTSLRPVLVAGNMTTATTMTDGSSYTVWVNVTNTIGNNSTALNVQVRFYLLAPSGSGTPVNIGGSPASTTFYGYNNATGTVNSTALGTGSVSLKFNETVRAEISFTPARQGTWNLWANATASNEFAGDYASGSNLDHVTVTMNPNTTDEYLYGGIAAVLIIGVVVFLVWWTRFRVPKARSSSGRSGLDRSGGGAKKEKPETKPSDDDEDDE